MEWELLDWDVIHVSETKSTDSVTLDKKWGSSSVIGDGIILSDHFSVENLIKGSDPRQYGVLESRRVYFGSEPSNQMHNPGEDQVDSSSDHLDVCRSSDDASDGLVRVSDFEAPDEKNVESEGVSGLTGGTVSLCVDASKCLPESDDLEVTNERYVVHSSEFWSDSGGNDLEVTGDSGIVNCEVEIVSENGVTSSEAIEQSGENTVDVVAVNSAVRSGYESKSRETVWYKMPFVFLKYYAFKIGPVWSVSMAAGVVGLVLLGRRLYNMKKKAQRFHLKVAIDDKNVSRVMNQAARLNEMFTEVRRVPVIRPALPSPGAWPILSLR